MQVFTYIRMSPTAFRELLLLKNDHEDLIEHQNNAQLAAQNFWTGKVFSPF